MANRLRSEGLTIGYRDGEGARTVVHEVDLRIPERGLLGLVGESGCGKSTLGRAMIGWIGSAGVRIAGNVFLNDTSLWSMPLKARRRLWGKTLAYVPQSASGALHPTRKISSLFDEALRTYGYPRRERHRLAVEALASVEIRDPEEALKRRAHQFSGGQKQRLALALAVVARPGIVVFDEPTTGVDVTVQSQITRLLRKLVDEHELVGLYISHDIGLVADLTSEIAVMYAGQVVEQGETEDVLEKPEHPYTQALIDAVPRRDGRAVRGIPGIPPAASIIDRCAFAGRCRYAAPACVAGSIALMRTESGRLARCIRVEEIRGASATTPVVAGTNGRHALASARLSVNDLTCDYEDARSRVLRAVDNVSFDVAGGEVLGLVGESGSGKTTILRAIAGLTTPVAGSIALNGVRLATRARARDLDVLRSIQIVFQDPEGSLNPRRTAGASIVAALRRLRPELPRQRRGAELQRLLELVQLDSALARRYPHELSGGEKQRVAIARALAAQPQVLLCDEVVSALDVSVQAELLNTLMAIRAEQGCSLVFVSHDLSVVRLISDRVYVLREGVVRESGPADRVLASPEDAYTRELVAAIPGRF